VGEALELFASFYRDPAEPGRLLEQLSLAGKRNTSFDKLSGGQRQRLSLALALVGNPRWPSWTSSAPASTPMPAATPGG
jgi:ABC-2 type transport system ATP-binding protein